MENKDWRAIRAIKLRLTDNPILFWVFYILREFALQSGGNKVSESLTKIEMAVRGAKIENGYLNLGVSGVRKRIGQLAYHGFVEAKEGAKPNDDTEFLSYRIPITIKPEFVGAAIPPELMVTSSLDDVEKMKERLDKSEELRNMYLQQTKRLREEVKLNRALFVPEFKLQNQDGSINERSVQYQRMWSWFVLLDIQAAFQKIVYRKSNPETPVQEPDYQTMAVWLSKYGMAEIESLFLKFYETKRLIDLKAEAGDRWPEAVLRFTFGALKKNHKNSNNDEKEFDDGYVPAGGWK